METIIEGVFQGNSRGFGFVVAEGGDLFIPADLINGAMHKDKVQCKFCYERGDGRRVGEVVKVLKRGYESVVGVYLRERGHGLVVADENRLGTIFIARGKNKGAGEGHKVVVRITRPPAENREAEGEVVEILGHINDPGVDVLSILRQMELPVEFSAEVMAAAAKTPQEVLAAEYSGRDDFRDRMIVTIDGDDTKDIDDAVSVTRLSNGNYELSVHIADVTHYVREGSPMDKEAFTRGTSIYLADRVVPMLPHALSNGICSLNPGVDRLTLSCIMEIDTSGTVISHRVVQSVINSHRRMTYTIVNDLLTNETSEYREEYAELVDMFVEMSDLAELLREKRVKRGAIGFDFPEAKITVDSTGWPTGILPYKRNIATGIIEEFMLAANETIAEEFFWLELPFVFRSHEEPDSEKLMRLREFVAHFGYSLKGSSVHPNAIQTLLSKVENTSEEHIINRMVLQSFKQARYTAENQGHFGLAARYYCHFTSPIRRYPDLRIHRTIKEYLNGKLNEERIESLNERMPDICANCSKTERAAETAEREVTALKKAQYMSDKLGRVFEGIISGMTSRGIYVELPNTVEGMISARDLPGDRYIFDREQLCFRGERTKKTYRIGDSVEVEVVRVSIQAREIDFIFC